MPDPSYELLLDRLKGHVGGQPDKKLFSFIGSGLDGGRIQKAYTYAQLADETTALAQRILAAGLSPGDR